MIPLTAATATVDNNTSPWLASIYAGVITAIIATIVLLISTGAENIIYYAVLSLLIGAGPILGYGIATGRIGGSVGAMIGGIIGNIPILNIILWPLLVGLTSRLHSFGRLFWGNLIGIIIGIVAFLVVETMMGQDPAWFWPSLVFGFSFWGGTMGAVLTAWMNE